MKNTLISRILLATIVAFCIIGRAHAEIFQFGLSEHPNEPLSSAFGTIEYQPGALTLNITYSVTSPVHEIIFYEGIGWIFTFASGNPSLPSVDTITLTRKSSIINQGFLNSLENGLSSLAISTDKYPYAAAPEIYGFISPTPVPEPSVLTLLIVTSMIFFAMHNSQPRISGAR